MFYKGKFSPKFPGKYKGDPTNIVYRSLWELRVMKYLDENASVLQWASEEVIIPYKSPVDGKYHRYFPDFWVKSRDKEGHISVRIFEVKPESQSVEPKPKSGKPTKKYLTEVARYGINSAKWTAAREYCKERGWTFHVLTERELGI